MENDTGATGARGPQGEKGETGATGAMGPQGPAGPAIQHALLLMPEGVAPPAGWVRIGEYYKQIAAVGRTPRNVRMKFVIWQKE